MKEFVRKVKSIYKKSGREAAKKYLNSISYRDYVDLGNTFLPENKREDGFINCNDSGSDFITNNILGHEVD